MHNEELHNLDSSQNIISMLKSEDEMGRAFNTHGRRKKLKGKDCSGNRTWYDDIKIL
jgi:hypothetical protein